MKLLPSRYVFCALRIATTIRAFGDLIPSSQAAAFWLCVWPGLLGWKRRVSWLFLHVSDPKKSRLSLWGIDSAGNLIIVVIRTNRGEALRDPFKGVVFLLKGRCAQRRWSTRELRTSWQASLKSEQRVVIVPSTYKRDVQEAFVKRQAAGNPPPIIIVLVGAARCEFRLSDEGLKNLLFLEKLAGSARVALRALSGRFGLRGVRIRCWSPRPTASSSRKWRRRLR